MSFISPEERRELDTLPLYSTNLEPDDGTNFNLNSPLNISDTDTQNYQAIKASQLQDHLRQIITQKQGSFGLDEISDFSDNTGTRREIETKSEKGRDSLTDAPPCFIGGDYDSAKLLTVVKKNKEKSEKFDSQFDSILEQDGIYVTKQPKIKNTNKDRITTRLEWNANERAQYFDEEGNLRNNAPSVRQIPPPFKEEAILPPYYNSQKSQILPATVWGLENSTTARYIRVEVNKIQFTVHHLSSDEDILSQRLNQIYIQYYHAIQYPRENYYATRIKALRRDLKVCQDSNQRQQILEDIVNNHRMRDTEELATRMKLEQLLVTWHELKDLRDKNQYNLTTNALRWQSKKFTPEAAEQERIQFEKAINKRAKEIVELSNLKNEEADFNATISDLKQFRTDKGLRNPGEPLWRPVLYEIERSSEDQIASSDKKRLNQIKKVNIYVAFMMGTTELRSKDTNLDDNFVANIDTGCLASTMRVPNDVRIHIYESGDQKLSEIAVVPMPVLNGIPEDYIDYEFSAESKNKNDLVIQGYLNGRAFVVTDTNTAQTILPDSRKINDLRPEVTNRFLSIPKYLEVVAKHDPNDPYIVKAIGSVLAESGEQKIHNRFAIDAGKEATKFESMAPSNLCEVIHQKAYDKLYGDIDKQQANQRPKLQLSDVVREMPKATAGNFFSSLWNFLTFRRGKGVTVNKSAPSTHLQEFSYLNLKIYDFSGLPSEASGIIARIHFLDEIVESQIYDPINKIFREETGFTPTSTIRSTTNSPRNKGKKETTKNSNFSGFQHKFHIASSNNVPHFTDIEDSRVRIDLFDSVQQNFISTISIPLRSLFVNTSIEGNYSLFTAPFSLAFSSITNDTNNTIDSSRQRTMRINMSMTLRPALIPPKYVDTDPCGETPNVKRRALQIFQHFDEMNINRRIVPLATTQSSINSPAQQLLPCRFIVPQTIPKTLERTIPSLLSFVSIIPTTPDSLMPGTVGNRWSTSQEVLDRSCGTITEHAILLCNFLKYIEVDSYVILGHDALLGRCAFVGVKNGRSDDIQILDPTSGREVELFTSKASTLLDIGTVFNDRNIWFNIQKDKKEISHISWRFNDSRCWIPFFNKSTPREEASSPQENILVYQNSPIEHTEIIKRRVEDVIKGVTEQLRDQLDHSLKTRWDDADIYTSKLREILEFAAKGETEKLTEEFNSLTFGKTGRKKNIRLVGTPFFVAYVYDEDNIEKLRSEILEEIRYRGEYANTDKGIKFAAAANVTTFPNDIYGIWILLAAIIPTKKDFTSE